MAQDRSSILAPQEEPDLGPLRASHEADEAEAGLKRVFLQLYADHIRPAERAVNTLGIPHLGPLDQFERAVKAEGLALLRSDDEGAMRYMLRAWKARNPKRGLGMLKAYLELLWPNSWQAVQLWTSPVGYPATASPTQQPGHFLSSRVQVTVAASPNSAEVERIAPSLRSVLPARFVLELQLSTQGEAGMGLVAIEAAQYGFIEFTGTIA